jgi:hypothetical protein
MDDTLPDGYERMTVDFCNRRQASIKSINPIKLSHEKDRPMTYKFHVTAPAAQLSFDTIAKDLSYKNPIALVEVDTEKDSGLYVLLAYSIIQKYEMATDSPFMEFNAIHLNGYTMIEVNRKEYFTTWTEWCKRVKKMEWPDCMVDKGVVSVSLPNV